MLKTTAGLSLFLVLAFAGGGAACSSSSTGGGSGGNGAIVGGSSTTGGTKSDSNAAGTRTDQPNGGTTGNTAGTTGTTGGALTVGDACNADTAPIQCVDATKALGCNSNTMKIDSFNCVDELKAIGVVSSGCTAGATGDQCKFDSFADADCEAGTSALAFCENVTDNTQLLNVYVNCFEDNNMGHTVIPCFAKYVSPAMMTAADCQMAETTCFPDTGAGGAGAGAGGAAP